jgi:hypothetical protein
VHHPPPGLSARHLAERHVDHAFPRLRHAVDDRQIGLVDAALLERLRETLVRLGVAGEQQAAAGVAIEAVDRARRPLEPEAQGEQVILQGQRAVARRVHRQAGRLVDHQRLAIQEQNPIGPHHEARFLLLQQRNVPAATRRESSVYAELTF